VAVSPAQDVIHFGRFELDLKAGQLTRNGSNLRLPQQPLQNYGNAFGPPMSLSTSTTALTNPSKNCAMP